MLHKRLLPYGAWDSPLTPALLARGAARPGQLAAGGSGPVRLWWTESRPAEKGRMTLLAMDASGAVHDITPAPADVRGGAFTAAGDTAWYTDAASGGLVRCGLAGPVASLPLPAGLRTADFQRDTRRNRLVCVSEHLPVTGAVPAADAVVNRLAAIADDGCFRVLAEGADFYASPRLSPDGSRLAWLQWNHPDMPWDATELWEARLGPDGMPVDPRRVAGGRGVSIFQPEYAPDGQLFYVSDVSGFWNLHRDGAPPRAYPLAAEFGLPQWQFGMSTYGFLADGRLVAAHAVAGEWRLAILDPETGLFQPLDLPWCAFDSLTVAGAHAWFIGGRPDGPDEIVELHPDSGQWRVLRRMADIAVDAAALSVARPLTFASADGQAGHAYYYPPASDVFAPLPGTLPPLILRAHGGPTAQAGRAFSLKVQFWTSRGFAVLDVNYSGSTGFGRAYRERLNGRWGEVDVEDCIAAARAAVAEGLADPERLIITGSSAGGYTTLSALAFHRLFRAGCSLYGVADLAALAQDTHKFESRYLDRLVGRWPEDAALYRARSPLYRAAGITCPLLFLQGQEDKVVPPAQSERMAAALRAAGLPVACILFPGEGHGFRRAETMRRALEAELSFYGQVFGFQPAGDIAHLTLENL